MVYITGDTHGPTPFGLHSVDGFGKRLNIENFPEQREMTRDDFVIICGDFGGVWKWFFGHYHANRQILNDYIMLYEQIIQIQ